MYLSENEIATRHCAERTDIEKEVQNLGPTTEKAIHEDSSTFRYDQRKSPDDDVVVNLGLCILCLATVRNFSNHKPQYERD